METKLTLTLSEDVVAVAERYAETEGTTVEKLAEGLLAQWVIARVDALASQGKTPTLDRWRGALVRGERADHENRLAEKYGARIGCWST